MMQTKANILLTQKTVESMLRRKVDLKNLHIVPVGTPNSPPKKRQPDQAVFLNINQVLRFHFKPMFLSLLSLHTLSGTKAR